MKEKPIVIEVCGVPYSHKTTVITKLEKHLRTHGIRFEVVAEFRGDNLFYDSAKYTSDLNIVRSGRCLERIITSKHTKQNKVILVDRGIFDTYCWINWFEKRDRVVDLKKKYSKIQLELIAEYACKYKIVWLDINPLLSVASHGRTGNIVNTSTITQLQQCYQKASDEYSETLDIEMMDCQAYDSDVIAERIFHKYKLHKLAG